MSERETWTSRVGFIFAAVGSAVGLGNIWSFPFQTATNGGAAFLVVYLFAVFLIGFPAMMIEFVIGRRGLKNPVTAFESIGYDDWSFIGGIGVFSSFVTLSFYSVIGGWVLSYIVGSITGAYFGGAEGFFGTVSTGAIAILGHFVFMALTVGIVAYGVADGIERSTKFMIPAIIILLVAMGLWAVTLPGAAEGYAFYLSPNVGELMANLGSIVPAAMGQAFFTLSLGFSVMIAYSSYLGRDDSLPVDGGAIVVINTLVALLAGFVIFPVFFATIGKAPASGGVGTTFVALAGAFAQLPAGQIIGLIFFVVLLFAALSSAISLLEVPVAYVAERHDYQRSHAAIGTGLVIFIVGLIPAFGLNYLTLYNDVVFKFLLPAAVLLLAIFVGWIADIDAMDELEKGTRFGETFTTAWVWWVRTVVPIAVLVTLYLGIKALYSGMMTGKYF